MIFTQEARQRLVEYLAIHHLPKGLGTEDSACSVAAINLALSGELTDNIPPCMSRIIGEWIIGIQDAMPDELRNSDEWKELLPLAAGTGRDLGKEQARLDLIMDWMWKKVLPTVQPIADQHGFGEEWHIMTTKATAEATAEAIPWAYQEAAEVHVDLAVAAARAAARAQETAAARAPWGATAWATTSVACALKTADDARAAWAAVDPVGLLRKMVAVKAEKELS